METTPAGRRVASDCGALYDVSVVLVDLGTDGVCYDLIPIEEGVEIGPS